MAIYVHDCEQCRYLSSDKLGQQPVDVYYCSIEQPYPTVIIRFGSEPGNYYSMDVKTIQSMRSNPVSSTNQLLLKYFHKLTVEEACIY